MYLRVEGRRESDKSGRSWQGIGRVDGVVERDYESGVRAHATTLRPLTDVAKASTCNDDPIEDESFSA